MKTSFTDLDIPSPIFDKELGYIDLYSKTCECYNPSQLLPSTSGGRTVRPDFCGWSALGPISLLIKNILEFHVVDACKKRVEWRNCQEGCHSVKNFHFRNIVAYIIFDGKREVKVQCNEPLTFAINGLSFSMHSDINSIAINTEQKT